MTVTVLDQADGTVLATQRTEEVSGRALDTGVLRLVRVAIGPLHLGELAKGQWRALTAEEVAALCGD